VLISSDGASGGSLAVRLPVTATGAALAGDVRPYENFNERHAMKDFKDRVAVVTGAASGIGRGMAERFASEGMKVVLADVEEKALKQAEAEFREKGFDVVGVLTDVSKPEEMERLADETLNAFGKVHVVCNNAGVAGSWGPTWENTLQDWQWIMGVNLWGVIHGVRTFLPIMLKQDEEGHIVNTASLAGLMPGAGIYGVTKQAVVALSESLYNELKLMNAKVGVSVLCPGWVDTKIGEADRNRPAELTTSHAPDPRQEVVSEIVRNFLKNGKSPAEIANAVFEAIRDDQLYIITHPDMDFIFKERFDNIVKRRNPTPRLLGS
jgi:NAD(P)-dependent dehydrogenase (short-subunit alcohol dehydrogenase family)